MTDLGGDDRKFLAERQHEDTRARFMARAAMGGVDEFSLKGNTMSGDDGYSGGTNSGGMSPAEVYGSDEPTPLRPRQDQEQQGRPMPPPLPPKSKDRPRYIEIEIDGDDTEVGLTKRDGSVTVVTIPPMTMARINMLGWHQERVNTIQNELLREKELQRATRIAERAKAAQENLVMYMIPNFPVGLFGQIPAAAFKRLTDLIQQMSEEALELDNEDDAPNA